MKKLVKWFFCTVSAVEAFINYISDSFDQAGTFQPYEIAFLTDRKFDVSGGTFIIRDKKDMRTDEFALDYLARAEMILGEAKNAASKNVYSLAIRRAQETVELSLKAALRFLAIKYPKDHDVGDVLLSVKEIRSIPTWFRDKIEFMARVSSELSEKARSRVLWR